MGNTNQGGEDFVFIRGQAVTTQLADDAVFSVTIDGDNQPISGGDTLDVDYTIDNTGSQQDTQDIRLSIGETVVDRDSGVTIAAGGSASGTLSYTTSVSETQFDATVWSDDDSVIRTINFIVTFDCTITSINSRITEGETLDVTADIENTGSELGTQTVTMLTDGTERGSTSLRIDSGETKTRTFQWDTQVGDGQTDEYTVKVESEDTQDTESVEVRKQGAARESIFVDGNENAYVHDIETGNRLESYGGTGGLDYGVGCDINDDYVILGFDEGYLRVFDRSTGNVTYERFDDEDYTDPTHRDVALTDTHFGYRRGDDKNNYGVHIRKTSDNSLTNSTDPISDAEYDSFEMNDDYYIFYYVGDPDKTWDTDKTFLMDRTDDSVVYSHEKSVTSETTLNSTYYAIHHSYNNLEVYRISDGGKEYSLSTNVDLARDMAMNDEYIAVANNDNNEIEIFELSTGNNVKNISTSAEPTSVDLASDRLIYGDQQSEAHVLDISDWSTIHTFTDGSNIVRNVGFNEYF